MFSFFIITIINWKFRRYRVLNLIRRLFYVFRFQRFMCKNWILYFSMFSIFTNISLDFPSSIDLAHLVMDIICQFLYWLILSQFFHKWRNIVRFSEEFNIYLILLTVSKSNFQDYVWVDFLLLAIWKIPVLKHIIRILCIKTTSISLSDDKRDKMLKFSFWYVQQYQI